MTELSIEVEAVHREVRRLLFLTAGVTAAAVAGVAAVWAATAIGW